MTKTELSRITRAAYVRNRYTDGEHRLNRCQAWYYKDEDLNAIALRSYRSIVAVYWAGVVWEFDRWSNTTTSHVRKFAHQMGAPVISLYRNSGMRLSDFWLHEKLRLERCDRFSCIYLNPQLLYDYSRSG